MNNKKLTQALKQIELLIGKRRYEAFSQLYFLFAIVLGFLLNLAASVFNDLFGSYACYRGVVLISTLILLSLTSYWIHYFYLKPIHEAEKKLEKLKGKNNELFK